MWGVEICKIYSKIMKKYHHCVKFTYPLSFQTRIPKVDQHTGGKWLIHGTKHRKDNHVGIYGSKVAEGLSAFQRRSCFNIQGPCHQKQESQAGISNCIPQNTVGCNYLSLPKIPASGVKVLICTYTWCSYISLTISQIPHMCHVSWDLAT